MCLIIFQLIVERIAPNDIDTITSINADPKNGVKEIILSNMKVNKPIPDIFISENCLLLIKETQFTITTELMTVARNKSVK